jgi:hypothetical protein
MTEQPNAPERPAGEDQPPVERTGRQSERPGPVRTEGETAVDDAMGTGDNVH